MAQILLELLHKYSLCYVGHLVMVFFSVFDVFCIIKTLINNLSLIVVIKYLSLELPCDLKGYYWSTNSDIAVEKNEMEVLEFQQSIRWAHRKLRSL